MAIMAASVIMTEGRIAEIMDGTLSNALINAKRIVQRVVEDADHNAAENLNGHTARSGVWYAKGIESSSMTKIASG